VFPYDGGSAQGPRADDLQITSSTAGKRIPYIVGRFVTDGNVIWGQELIEKKKTKRVGKSLFSSGTKVTTYSYFFTGAIGLCEGPISGILRIWAYGKLIYDARPLEEREAEFEARAAQTVNFGIFGNVTFPGTDLNAQLEDVMTVYLGTDDQEPDPVIQELEGGSDADVPAFRGLAYVVFNELPLDQFDYGARVPQLRFEVCRPLPEVPAPSVDDDNTGDEVLAA